MNSQIIPFERGQADITLTVNTDQEVLTALANDTAFPEKEIRLLDGGLSLNANKDIKLNGGAGNVTFSAGGGVFSGFGVYQDGANALAAIQKVEPGEDSFIAGFTLPQDPASNFLAFRWGFDAKAAGSGAVAFGPAAVTFGASGNTDGLFAVIRQLPRNLGARTAVARTINSWQLPRQVSTLNDLEPGTWIIAETAASLALSLGIQYGYEMNWVRENVSLGALSGDIGLKIQLGVAAQLGFNTSGRYAVVVSREIANPQVLRLRVFRLNQNGWSFAFNAGASVQFDPGSLAPEKFEDFIRGVFNLNGSQILKDLDTWISSEKSIAELLGSKLIEKAEEKAKILFKEMTGLDFEDGKEILKGALEQWHALPHNITSLLYSYLDKATELTELKDFLKQLKDGTPESLAGIIAEKLRGLNFFESLIGKWLLAGATKGIVTLLNNAPLLEEVQQLAEQTLSILDGGTVESLLTRLQGLIEKRLGLDKIFSIVNETDFKKIDGWLKARLSAFLGKTVVFAELEKIKFAINKLSDQLQSFYEKGREALTQNYSAQFHYAYQKTTTRTALLDVEFDFAETNPSLQLGAVLGGSFNDLLLRQMKGVRLNQGTLTHEVNRQSHLEISFPFKTIKLDHINNSLSTVNAVDTADGRLLVYDLEATDVVTRRNIRDSRLAVGYHYSANTDIRKFFDQDRLDKDRTAWFRYSLKLVAPDMKRATAQYHLLNFLKTYFPAELQGKNESFISSLDDAVEQILHNGPANFGDTLISLNLSLPPKTMRAWENASSDANARQYKIMSLRLQRILKERLFQFYFQDIGRFNTEPSAFPLIVYSALPNLNDARLKNNVLHIPEIDQSKGVLWDSTEDSIVRAIVHSNKTKETLIESVLPKIRSLLLENNLGSIAEKYEFDDFSLGERLRKLLGQTPQRALFNLLLRSENDVIKKAVEVGVAFSKFASLADRKPQKALAELSDFGAKLSSTFNNLVNKYTCPEFRSLGTDFFLEASSALNPELRDVKPAATLDIFVLKPKTEGRFPMSDFLKGELPEKKDIAVQQHIVTIGND